MATDRIHCSFTLALAVAAGFVLSAWADRTITGTYSLSSSEDWSADGVIAVAPGATLDLNGHTLTVAALTGEGVITSTVTTSPDLTGSGTAECSAGIDSVDAGATADRVFDGENRVIVKNENGYWPFSVIYDFVTATLVDSYGIKTGTNPSHFLKRSPVVSWTSETKPQNVDTVKFTRVDDRKYWLEVKDDGLYCISPGFMILIK